MSNSMPGTNLMPEPGTGLSWPQALMIAFAIELTLIFLALNGTHAKPAAALIPVPVKIARVVTIADAPEETTPAPATPTKKQEPQKTIAKPLLRPSPKPQTDSAPIEPSPALQANTAPHVPQTDCAPQEALPVAPKSVAPISAKPDKAAGVRRGIVPKVRVEPDYPARAIAGNIEGIVVAHVTIEKDGSVSAVSIVRAQPVKIFDQEAIRALMRWKFSQNDGGTVGEVELRFNLN